MNDRLRTIMLKAWQENPQTACAIARMPFQAGAITFAYWLMPGGTLARLERLELDQQIEQVYEGEGECK